MTAGLRETTTATDATDATNGTIRTTGPSAWGGDLPVDARAIVAGLEAGTLRAAEPDPDAPGGWRVRTDVKAAILGLFADRTMTEWAVGPFVFRDRIGVPPRDLSGGPWRIVPGGTSVRAGAYLGNGVVIMPPSYVNVGAWIGDETMVDSGVLVGSCAQIGARVHLAAGVVVGGVLEPPGARPVIVEDEAFVGAGVSLLEGVLVGRGAVIGAGVTLTGTSRLYDLVRERVLTGTPDAPLVVPPNAVVVPGARPLEAGFARDHGLSVTTAVLVKDRDAGTSARVALEAALR
jgi:2,3,4,5-tetrahydropyridine-2,6-dicarboxylate N-succinyltransferase